jgi:hypothetical protein
VLEIAPGRWLYSCEVQSGGVGDGDGGFSTPLSKDRESNTREAALRRGLELIAADIANDKIPRSAGAQRNGKRILDWTKSQLLILGNDPCSPGDSGAIRRRRSARLAMPDPLASFTVDRSTFELYRTDGIAFLEAYAFTGQELVYCDPPYVISTRSKTQHGCGGSLRYKHEMADVDHRRLLRVLQELPCRVIVSGYDSALYRDALKTWIHTTFPAMTRKGPKTESLWCNFAPPMELHDYRYLGEGFRERENTKRLIRRWRGKLERMPRLRRQALLAAIADLG